MIAVSSNTEKLFMVYHGNWCVAENYTSNLAGIIPKNAPL